jgi:uncharacterized protein
MSGANGLDASAVHPEAYEVVERIAKETGRPVHSMIGDGAFLKQLRPEAFADQRFGVPTVRDILAELEKPGRDPRPEFSTAKFAEGVEKITDLKPGMRLEGVVTNVTAFGAFVDIGVHQDGLVHISELADRFVKDPREVVKAGDVVKVRVKDVDVERRRIALSMKSDSGDGHPARRGGDRPEASGGGRQPVRAKPPANHGEAAGESALAAALKRARDGGNRRK